jgi:hypothetical protein
MATLQSNAVAREFWEALEDQRYQFAATTFDVNNDIASEVLEWPQRPRKYRSLIRLLVKYWTEHLPSDRVARVAACMGIAKLLSCSRSSLSDGRVDYF